MLRLWLSKYYGKVVSGNAYLGYVITCNGSYVIAGRGMEGQGRAIRLCQEMQCKAKLSKI